MLKRNTPIRPYVPSQPVYIMRVRCLLAVGSLLGAVLGQNALAQGTGFPGMGGSGMGVPGMGGSGMGGSGMGGNLSQGTNTSSGGAGMLQGNERFLRQNRRPGEFVGTDLQNRRHFIGSQQGKATGRAQPSTTGLHISPPPVVNQPAPASQIGTAPISRRWRSRSTPRCQRPFRSVWSWPGT